MILIAISCVFKTYTDIVFDMPVASTLASNDLIYCNYMNIKWQTLDY